jgi:hypothetical protein
MSTDRFEDWLRDVARREFNPPPELPREAMWARIDAVRARRRGGNWLRRPLPWWGGAVAAALVVGIGLGRLLERQRADAETPVASAPARTPPATFQVAALEHLGRTEILLTAFRADARAGRVDGELSPWARDLLATTRLLLDSPAAEEPEIQALLKDLELVLVQIAQFPANRSRDELELINQALDERDIVTRLRVRVPPGPITVRS